MRLVSKPLEWMARRASPLLAVALFIGIVLPDLARLFKPLIGPSVVVLLIATLLRIDWPQALAYARRPGRVLVVVAWLMLGAPLVMAVAVRLIAPPEMLGHALVLMASSPVLISVPTFALMLGLDAPLALVAMVVTSALQPFAQPPLTLALLGVELNIGVAPLMTRLALLVGGSFVAALLIRWLAGRKRIEQAAAPIGGLAVLMLIVFGIGIMDGVTAMLIERPGHVLLFLSTAFAANFALQALGGVLFWGLCRAGVVDWCQGLTAALASGNRNLAILVAALGPSIHPDLLLYLAMGQFPMFLVPAALGPVYRMLLRDRGP